MTDSPDRTPDATPHEADDRRDDVLADRLGVPALDEVTRRRLVRGALDATASVEAPVPDQGRGQGGGQGGGQGRGRGRWWAAAAAAVVVAGLVTALVLRGGGSGDRPTAARAPAPTGSPAPSTRTDLQSGGAADRAVTPSTQTLAPAAGGTAASPGDLGQLGEVAGAATLRDRVDAARRTLADKPQTFSSSAPEAAPKAEPGTIIPCAAELTAARPDLGAIEAVGTATFHGRPATVVVATAAGGSARAGRTVAVVIVDQGCVVHSPVPLAG